MLIGSSRSAAKMKKIMKRTSGEKLGVWIIINKSQRRLQCFYDDSNVENTTESRSRLNDYYRWQMKKKVVSNPFNCQQTNERQSSLRTTFFWWFNVKKLSPLWSFDWPFAILWNVLLHGGIWLDIDYLSCFGWRLKPQCVCVFLKRNEKEGNCVWVSIFHLTTNTIELSATHATH